MKTTFADPDTETAPATPPASTALAAPASTEVVPDNFFSNEGVEGDFEQSDIKMPRLGLVQSVGPLSAELGFTPGTFVYNKEVVVGNVVTDPAKNNAVIGTDGLILTLFKLRKYYLEDIPYGTSEEMPAYFKTLEDARRAGFLPSSDKRQMGADHKYVKPVIDADILIQGDPAKHVSFPLDFNGTPYAAARWTLQSTAYNRVGKSFFTDSQLALKSCGLTGKFYTVSSRREKLGQNFVFTPKAALKGLNTPEFIAWARGITSKQGA